MVAASVQKLAEGAIEIINGKAKLVSEIYCDGLGACIGHCPQKAITIEKRESAEFDETEVKQHLSRKKPEKKHIAFTCPGLMTKQLRNKASVSSDTTNVPSQLIHWPVQLKLVPVNAPYFANADLLMVGDCVPFAMGDFHNKLLKGKSVVIGCPKLDDTAFYIDKFAEILQKNKINSLTVIHMEVPCCFGLTNIARQAIRRSKANISLDDITIDLHGNISNIEKISETNIEKVT